MSVRCRFDREKAIEALLYIAQETTNVYTVLKVMYFADKAHLEKYGRLICGDSYVAMRYGPVPSGAYDLVKSEREDVGCWTGFAKPDAFTVVGNDIVPKRAAKLDLLSESDRECLDAALKKYGHLPFGALVEISHQDKAYKAADENDFIPLEVIVGNLPNGDALLEYLHGN
jgi:uncharacterized phage-associated protein